MTVVPAHLSAEPTTVYVKGSDVWGVVVSGVVTFGGLALGVLYVLLSAGVGSAVGVLVILGPVWLLLGGYQALRALRHVLNPLPALLLDPDGLECAYGRIRWTDVVSVDMQPRVGDSAEPDLIFTLVPEMAWQPVEQSYSSYSLSSGKTGTFELDFWATRDVVRRTLGRYYAGPVRA